MKTPINYVVGFLFTPDRSRVLLVEKNRPDWMKGKLNGVGGKLQPGENNYMAMCREFREEAGVDIGDWQPFAMLTDVHNYTVRFFKSFSPPDANPVSKTDEQVGWVPVMDIDVLNLVPNLRWLIPLALDEHAADATVREVRQ